MAEFVHRQDRPGPHIHYGEVRFPDEHDLGTGTDLFFSQPVDPACTGTRGEGQWVDVSLLGAMIAMPLWLLAGPKMPLPVSQPRRPVPPNHSPRLSRLTRCRCPDVAGSAIDRGPALARRLGRHHPRAAPRMVPALAPSRASVRRLLAARITP